MPATIECHGEIEIVCQAIGDVAPNKQAKLVFRTWEDAGPPFQISIKSPTGNIIVERVMRILPTGEPQSPPPVTFTVIKGKYEIAINELRGTAEGHAVLDVE